MSNKHFVWDNYSDQPHIIKIELLKIYEKKRAKKII